MSNAEVTLVVRDERALPSAYMTFTQAVQYLGISKSTLERWVAQGKVPVKHFESRRRRFLRTDIENLLT